MARELQKRSLCAEITWLPLRAEYAPWTVPVPKPPPWANVVHVNSWLHSRFIPKSLPVVATLHHSVHHPDLEPYKGRLRSIYHRRWIGRVERVMMHRAGRVVAVSRFAAETARKTLRDRRIEVIYNGVNVDEFIPSSTRQLHKPFRLLYVGGWMARKGVDLLAPIMRELGDDFDLCYTGGSAADSDRALMPPNAQDIGRLVGTDAIVSVMQDADAFLFPSRNEGFGLVVAEAMACGLPVIATRASSLTEIVEDGVTGILCPQDDDASFVDAAKRLATNVNLTVSMSRASRAVAVQKFGIGVMADAYLVVYEELTNAHFSENASIA
ncbi:MAG: glycosyltransferase family 1 protein [Rhodanobacteraceae bacterium]|nr:MAG: glycosyltransferase family 1 protein [Rhodanobacteraceae bacterium]